MNAVKLEVSQLDASIALREYKQHRNIYDKRDWEIERIYRAISRGKMVISVQDSIRRAGLDDKGLPKLAICQAHAEVCVCVFHQDSIEFGIGDRERTWQRPVGRVRVEWPLVGWNRGAMARLPRIPPQHRPAANALPNYHMLWEADWTDIPRDPYLLRRIGKDAWVVVAAWDLTDVEVSVIRSHTGRQV